MGVENILYEILPPEMVQEAQKNIRAEGGTNGKLMAIIEMDVRQGNFFGEATCTYNCVVEYQKGEFAPSDKGLRISEKNMFCKVMDIQDRIWEVWHESGGWPQGIVATEGATYIKPGWYVSTEGILGGPYNSRWKAITEALDAPRITR